MIRKYLLLLFLLLISSVLKAESSGLLIFETTGGVKVSISLSEDPEITFKGGTMIITTNKQTQKIEISSITNWYAENTSTGINEIVSYNEPQIQRTNNEEITIEGLTSAANVQIYSIDGQKQSVHVSRSDGGKSIINISSLPKGVYIVSVNKQQAIKIFKQ